MSGVDQGVDPMQQLPQALAQQMATQQQQTTAHAEQNQALMQQLAAQHLPAAMHTSSSTHLCGPWLMTDEEPL